MHVEWPLKQHTTRSSGCDHKNRFIDKFELKISISMVKVDPELYMYFDAPPVYRHKFKQSSVLKLMIQPQKKSYYIIQAYLFILVLLCWFNNS